MWGFLIPRLGKTTWKSCRKRDKTWISSYIWSPIRHQFSYCCSWSFFFFIFFSFLLFGYSLCCICTPNRAPESLLSVYPVFFFLTSLVFIFVFRNYAYSVSRNHSNRRLLGREAPVSLICEPIELIWVFGL